MNFQVTLHGTSPQGTADLGLDGYGNPYSHDFGGRGDGSRFLGLDEAHDGPGPDLQQAGDSPHHDELNGHGFTVGDAHGDAGFQSDDGEYDSTPTATVVTSAGDDGSVSSVVATTWVANASSPITSSTPIAASSCPTVGDMSGSWSVTVGSPPVTTSLSPSGPGPVGALTRLRPAHPADDVRTSAGSGVAFLQPTVTPVGAAPVVVGDMSKPSASLTTASDVPAAELLTPSLAPERSDGLLTAVSVVQAFPRVYSTTLFAATELSAAPSRAAQAQAFNVAVALKAAQQVEAEIARLASEAAQALASAHLEAGPAPVVGRVVYNLIHLDALAAFSDGANALINESSSIMRKTSPSRARAWIITSLVVAGDAVLIGYLLRTRSDETEENAKPAPIVALHAPRAALRRAAASLAEREFAAEA